MLLSLLKFPLRCPFSQIHLSFSKTFGYPSQYQFSYEICESLSLLSLQVLNFFTVVLTFFDFSPRTLSSSCALVGVCFCLVYVSHFNFHFLSKFIYVLFSFHSQICVLFGESTGFSPRWDSLSLSLLTFCTVYLCTMRGPRGGECPWVTL